MKYEFERDGKQYAVFHREYGFAVYLREDGEITERIGGFTKEQLLKDFPEVGELND